MTRRPVSPLVITLIIALASASIATAEIYRYIDAEGEVHLVGDLGMVPPEYREQALRDFEGRDGEGTLNVVHEEASPAKRASGSEPARSGSSTTVVQGGEPTRGSHTEDWWRDQSLSKQRRIEDLERELEELQEEEENESLIYGRPGARGPGRAHGPADRRRRARTAAVLSDADDEDYITVEELEDEIARAEADFADFEERARRADVPPGWLR